MVEDEGEIEYLDEDEDLVQQYVQGMPVSYEKEEHTNKFPTTTPLLVERKIEKRKRIEKTEEEDSDYDPTEDLLAMKKKKKIQMKKPPRTYYAVKHHASDSSSEVLVLKTSNDTLKLPQYSQPTKKVLEIDDRIKLKIELPNYQDPLCLSVKAIHQSDADTKRLWNWNKMCLEVYQKTDNPLKPSKGDAVSSTRIFVLKNVSNNITRKVETSLFTKTTVKSSEGADSTEATHSILPNFRERKVLTNYQLLKNYKKAVSELNEIILSKENYQNEEFLVAYNPKDYVSAVYKFCDKLPESDSEEQDKRLGVREVTSARVCAVCYQSSWRGGVQAPNDSIPCPICGHSCVSVYGALSHLKIRHTEQEVRKAKLSISKVLAKIVDYHYKCRICQLKLNSIKVLKQHVKSHQGKNMFKCDIGNHLTR